MMLFPFILIYFIWLAQVVDNINPQLGLIINNQSQIENLVVSNKTLF